MDGVKYSKKKTVIANGSTRYYYFKTVPGSKDKVRVKAEEYKRCMASKSKGKSRRMRGGGDTDDGQLGKLSGYIERLLAIKYGDRDEVIKSKLTSARDSLNYAINNPDINDTYLTANENAMLTSKYSTVLEILNNYIKPVTQFEEVVTEANLDSFVNKVAPQPSESNPPTNTESPESNESLESNEVPPTEPNNDNAAIMGGRGRKGARSPSNSKNSNKKSTATAAAAPKKKKPSVKKSTNIFSMFSR